MSRKWLFLLISVVSMPASTCWCIPPNPPTERSALAESNDPKDVLARLRRYEGKVRIWYGGDERFGPEEAREVIRRGEGIARLEFHGDRSNPSYSIDLEDQGNL